MADLISRVYSNFRGADFRGEEINLIRSPDCLNVWKDYKETESIRTRPEMELLKQFDDTIWGVFFFNDMMLVHSGTSLYKVVGETIKLLTLLIRVEDGVPTTIKIDLNEAPSNAFIYENVFYLQDGKGYYKWEENDKVIQPVSADGYIPTTSIGRSPKGGNTTHEDVNMLSRYRINTFLADGLSKEYYLDTLNIDNEALIVKVDGVVKSSSTYSVDYAKGKITFNENNIPPVPKTDGQDNVSIQFSKRVTEYEKAIAKCTMLQVFDNRVFFSGNPDYPNSVWHCSLNDPTYISDTDHYKEGLDSAAVKGLVAGNNALWAFREPSDTNTTVFYHTPTIDDEYGKIYPNTHSSITTGCIGKAINFNDDIVFFSERGMEGISGDITTEQVLGHRSTLVDRKLTAEPNYKDMILVEWEGYLLVIIGNKVYLADSRTAFTNENHIEYDWFYWEFSKAITCATVNKGILYLGTNDGIYTLTDTESAVESYWVTPKDKFKYPNKLKTTNKRGCVAEATGDISVYAKLEDTDFELIGEYKNITDYCVSRIKRKKFKDIQLKFYSKTRFSLETATLECFIGGYIKR